MDRKKPDLADWLNFKQHLDYTRYPRLGSLTGSAVLITVLVILFIAIVGLFQLLGAFIGIGSFAGDGTGAAIRNIGLVLAALFGAPFLVWRSIVAQKQVNVAEQGQITDRINKAVEGLGAVKTVRELFQIPRYQKKNGEWKRDADGNPQPALRPDGMPIVDRESRERTSPNLEVRIGAIYALERIAQDSLRDHIQIMEILCAYIRENAQAKSLEASEPPFGRATPRTDIQVAINVVGRRSNQQIDLEWQEEYRLDLRKTDLSGIDFQFKNFSAAMFHESRLEAAFFRECKLIGTQFFGALLNYSDFFQAELRGTIFDLAVINLPEVGRGGMGESISMGKIYGVSLAAADITAISYLGEPEEMNLTFGSADTKLHRQLEFDRKAYHRRLHKIRKKKKEGKTEEAAEMETDLYQNGFVDWFPHPYSDGARGWAYHNFLDRLELHGWPYQ